MEMHDVTSVILIPQKANIHDHKMAPGQKLPISTRKKFNVAG